MGLLCPGKKPACRFSRRGGWIERKAAMDHSWLAVFTENESDRNYMCNAIYQAFGGELEVRPVSLRTVSEIREPPAAVAVNRTSRKIVHEYFPYSQVIYIQRFIRGSNLEKLVDLPEGERVLVVNYPEEIAMETVENLLSLGINHLQLVAYWPGSTMDVSDFDTVVYAGFRSYCPEGKKMYIDLGYRTINQSSLAQIQQVYGLPSHYLDTFHTQSVKMIVNGLYRIRNAWQQTKMMKENFEQVCFISETAILNIDPQYCLSVFNPAAEHLFGISYQKMIGQSYVNCLKAYPQLVEMISGKQEVRDQLLYIRKTAVLCNIHYIQIQAASSYYISVSLTPIDVLQGNEEKARIALRKKKHTAKYTFDQIKGSSEAIQRVKALAQYFALSNMNILITGESGTGKELFAQSIHNASFRANGPFVAANFASIPESLIESELFGYEEGAFTGAVKGGRQGLFRSAHKGTLFLDEIGDASLSVQSRLLRAIEEKEIMPVGSARAIPVDVRIICATNRDLLQMVRDGQFRQDLYYRIKGGCLHIPPLRERTSDILEILQDMTGGLDLPKPLERQLLDYYWPGNIRELRSIAQCLEVFEQNQQILDENMRREVLHSFFESLHPMDEAVMLQEEDKRILQAVDEMNRQSRSAGRYSLAGHPLLASCGMTESKIKLRLKRLEKNGYLYAGRTRQGVSLTEKGKSFLQAQETDN